MYLMVPGASSRFDRTDDGGKIYDVIGIDSFFSSTLMRRLIDLRKLNHHLTADETMISVTGAAFLFQGPSLDAANPLPHGLRHDRAHCSSDHLGVLRTDDVAGSHYRAEDTKRGSTTPKPWIDRKNDICGGCHRQQIYPVTPETVNSQRAVMIAHNGGPRMHEWGDKVPRLDYSAIDAAIKRFAPSKDAFVLSPFEDF